MPSERLTLCLQDGCRLLQGHGRQHNKYPSYSWAFMQSKDRDKITKAGFATPRGGKKGAYQNHVLRSNRVIIPYERLAQVNLENYRSGYVIRLLPEQYFSEPGHPKAVFEAPGAVRVGDNAFILYRTHESFERYPPLADWKIRGLERAGLEVGARESDVVDIGHFVKRIAKLSSARTEIEEGPPQGVFAPEYADKDTNYLCRCVLAVLTVQGHDSPYTTKQAQHLITILEAAGVYDLPSWENRGITRAGFTCCPLCLRFLKYQQLHDMVSFTEESGLGNAAEQILGATRSTVVNLFHLMPLTYESVEHIPTNVAWGHAICNTRLGQRICHPLAEVTATGLKIGVIKAGGIVETFGWISTDYEMIRSPRGAVWIRLHRDMTEDEWQWLPSQPDIDNGPAIDRSIAE